MSRAWIAISLAFCTTTLAAQEPPAEAADVAIIATVRAKQLTFTQVPNVRVTFSGNGATVWKSDRTNLPEKVEPYVTYRDIGIRLTITSTLPNIEQILDDALGPQKGDSHAPDRDSRRPDAGGNTAHSATTATAGSPAATDDHID